MKKTIILSGFLCFIAFTTFSQVAVTKIIKDPHSSAALDVQTTTKGFLPPCLSQSERDAISNPATGLVIFNTTTNCLNFFNGIYWYETCGSPNPGTVFNPVTGKTWMNRNLGASQVATSSTDAAAYGDLYQWGRATEGHESRISGTTTTIATTAVPMAGNTWDGLFIIVAPVSPWDWLTPQDNTLWQGVSGTNNPCPAGFRLPTGSEWEAERLSWATNNAAGAFGSPLKLALGGYRSHISGVVNSVGGLGYHFSSTAYSITVGSIYFTSSGASTGMDRRAHGFSVRCIQD